ncbi:hypothetical protein H6P81_005143 [Aristolochia fimbriata]|uniref:NADH dehydrogenase [ubiquinone] 1 alpha subcomplex assembly factor 3 n=1 Tax=Aristolochia fimbriata TaxID=158543 RepID=A0AAV7EUP3_ARIFI|nr:hypothetical protein H6P81_005143 [Aristolochia fimbriata]
MAGIRQKASTTLPLLVKSLGKRAPQTVNKPIPSLRRTFSLYDQINLINNVPEDQLRFQSYTDTGFTVSGVDYEGSLLVIDKLLMSWSPTKFSEVTPDSLSIFKLVRPIPEIMILGCGKQIELVSPQLRQFIRSTGMKLEVLDSRNAASTFNILNEEGRMVAAAVLPYTVEPVPSPIDDPESLPTRHRSYSPMATTAGATREGTAKATVAEHISQAVLSTSNLLHLMQESSPSQALLAKLPKKLLAKASTVKNTEHVLEQMPRAISSLDAYIDSGLRSVPHLNTVIQLLSNMENRQLNPAGQSNHSQEDIEYICQDGMNLLKCISGVADLKFYY